MNKYSKEYLFRECVLHHHCILLHLSKGILWDDKIIYDIYMNDIVLKEKEQKQMLDNWANNLNTYGIFVIKAFTQDVSPLDARQISLSIDDLYEIELNN